METVTGFIFFGSISLQMVTAAMIMLWKDAYSLEGKLDKPRQCIKKQSHQFVDKGPYSQSCNFSNSYLQMWELDHREGRVLKNQWFWIVVLQKTLESPLDCKEFKPENPKGNQPWIFWEDWCWKWSSNTLATWSEEPTHR